jgi:hypothetical protein
MAGGGGARGGACDGLSGGDLAMEARARGRWGWLRAREVAVDWCITLGGGNWTGRSSE